MMTKRKQKKVRAGKELFTKDSPYKPKVIGNKKKKINKLVCRRATESYEEATIQLYNYDSPLVTYKFNFTC